jgi:hypothetical protein
MLTLPISRQINVLSLIAKHLTPEGQKSIYHAFVVSNFNFCPLIWHFCLAAKRAKVGDTQSMSTPVLSKDFEASHDALSNRIGTSSFSLSSHDALSNRIGTSSF